MGIRGWQCGVNGQMFRRQESYAHNLLLEGSGSGVAEIKLKVAELWEGNPCTTLDQGDLSFMREV